MSDAASPGALSNGAANGLQPAVDVLVIGGGPAGLSAATRLGRYQRSTAVVDAGQQRNLSADRAHGLPGRDPTTPQELLNEARAGLAQYPQVALHQGTVTAVHRADGLFHTTGDGFQVRAEPVVLATGVRDRFPDVAGFQEHYGTDVHHCLACEGFTARGQTVIVLGSGDQVPAYAAELLDWAGRVRIVTDTGARAFDDGQREALASQGFEIVDGTAQSLVGAPGSLTEVRLASGELVEGDQVFFSYARQPANDLARQLGCELDHEGRITVNGFQLTSVDEVYAAGDITAGWQLVPIALGKGSTAGLACATSLLGHRTAGPAYDPAPPTRRFTPHA